MDLISTQTSTLITTTGTVGNTLTTDGIIQTIGVDLIAGTLIFGVITLLFIIDRLLDLNHNELELREEEGVI